MVVISEFIVLVARLNVRNCPPIFLSVFLEVFSILLMLSKTYVCGSMLTFRCQNMSRRLVNPASYRCVTIIELDGILLIKWMSLLRKLWLVVIWTIVTLCLEVCHVSVSTSCRVFRIIVHVLSQNACSCYTYS